MKKTAKFVAAGVTALALAGGIGAGIASADPTTPAPTPSASASPTPGQTPTSTQQSKQFKQVKQSKKAQTKDGKRRGLLARAMHGEVTLGGQQVRVVAFQRGTVEKVSATEITVKSKDGFTATYVVNATTKVRKAKEDAAIGDVKVADRVRVVAGKDGSTLTAQTIGDHGVK
jgi:hypothetical protein